MFLEPWDPAFVSATEEWVHENLLGEPRSPVVLTSIELEEDLAQHKTTIDRNASSVFDVILDNVLRYFRLVRFYARGDHWVRAWVIPSNTPAHVAAGIVFHRRCTQCTYREKDRGCTRDFCTTHHDHFNRTAEEHLGTVDVGHASALMGQANVALAEHQFVTKDRRYRLQDGDVIKFTMSSKAVKEPEEQCVGYDDARPRLLHPVKSDLRFCIAGLTNTGKTTLFNNLTGSNAAVSPKVFTTRRVMTRTTEMPDDRFRWLADHFPKATLRPPRITFVDTPALMEGYDASCNTIDLAPWKNEVDAELRSCDIVYLVTKEFTNPSVELWEGDHNDEHSCSHGSGYEGSDAVAFRLMRKRDWKVLDQLRDNATLRNDLDELDTLDTIEFNLRGDDQSGRRFGFWDVTTDQRVRYHDWSEKELAVLERTRLLSAKPIVYVLNMDEEDFANASASATVVEARKFFERSDKDALLVPFAGGVLHGAGNASRFDDGELSGANTFVKRTLEHYQIGHFYTASQDVVATWTVKLGTTIGQAVRLVNATLEPNVTVVDVANMRKVMETGSVEKALSLGVFRRRPFEDEIEDGDVLLLTPELTNSTRISATTLHPPGPAAPTGEEGRYVASWGYAASLSLNLVLLMALAGSLLLLSSKNLRKRVRAFAEAHLRRRGRPQEPLLAGVSYEADTESIKL